MRSGTLENILDRDCFYGLKFLDSTDKLTLPALAKGKNGFLLDFGGWFQGIHDEFNCKTLFEKKIENSQTFLTFKDGWDIIPFAAGFEYPAKNSKEWICCLANISTLKRRYSRVITLLPKQESPALESLYKSCAVIIDPCVEPPENWEDILRLYIAKKNVPNTPLFFAAKYAWVLALILSAVPFFIVSKPDVPMTSLRRLDEDAKKYMQNGELNYVVTGMETPEQIAKSIIGRFSSIVANDNYAQKYLKSNGISSKLRKGDTLKLKIPETKNPKHRTMHPAWLFFTGLLNDSLAYITELYSATETATQRRHEAIDIGARKGTRIFSPFSGTAWTAEDERGGLMIAIAREKDVLVFMHCDKRFYLNGQTVMEGDPIATVGTSGHTTGPHVHLVAGRIRPNGERNINGLRYKPLDPFKWYLEDYSRQ